MIFGFSACEKKKNENANVYVKAVLIVGTLENGTATLSKTENIALSEEITLTVAPKNVGYKWENEPNVYVSKATLKSSSANDDVYTFVINGFTDNCVISVVGKAVEKNPIGEGEGEGEGEVTDHSGIENGHACVDLGLSVMWATCNVGAKDDKPEEYGNYYAWGAIEPKEPYDTITMPWYDQNSGKYTKYCTDAALGTVDNITTLEPEDDAAHVNWGGKWRMPTIKEQDELLKNCEWKWTTKNGVNGYEIKSKSEIHENNSIFLPAAGYKLDSNRYNASLRGYFWSSSCNQSNPQNAYFIVFVSNLCNWDNGYRYIGCPIRAVCPK